MDKTDNKNQRFSFSTAAERDRAYDAVSAVINGDHKISVHDAYPNFLLFVASTNSCNEDARIARVAEACRCTEFEEIHVASYH